MALDYCILYSCPIHEELPPESFVKRAKMKSCLRMIDVRRAQMADRWPDIEQAPVTLPFSIPCGAAEKSSMTVAELRLAWETVERMAIPLCGECPCNFRKNALGCFGAVTCPITKAGEEWLLRQFDPPEGNLGFVPMLIQENELTGESLDSRRGTPQSLCEASSPARKSLAKDGEIFSSSQLLEVFLACQPEIYPISLYGLCLDFRVVLDPFDERTPSGTAGPVPATEALLAMEAIFGPEAIARSKGDDWKGEVTQDHEIILLKLDGDTDRTVCELKELLLACWTAFRNNATMYIDG